ncbi:hypothetical protein Tco_1219885 [Tanacetum coccineum]
MMDTIMEEIYSELTRLYYQDYEWYEALENCKLKDEALRNKAIMEGYIKEDDDESHYEQKRQWNTYTNYDDAYEINHEHNKSKELCEVYEQPVCNIRRYMMIKYSFIDDEEYVAVKEDEYDDLTVMIGSLMYLTASRPDIQFSTCLCASAKKQSSVAMSSAEAKYVAAAGCCAQVLWIKSQLADYDVLYDKVSDKKKALSDL